MAICAVLLGGLAGFFSFVTALAFYDTTLLSAAAIYITAGLGTSLAIIFAGVTASHFADSKAKLASDYPQNATNI